MGIDGMRVGGGRCPPLIVAGLIVACFLLVCNWWSLSAENNELLHQIDGLSQQLKLSAEQRDQCATLRGNLEQQYKRIDEELATLHMQLSQEKEIVKSKEEAVAMCHIELDSLKKLDVTKTATIETLRVEKEAINEQLEAKEENNKKLREELEQLQDEVSKLKLNQDSTTLHKKSLGAGALAGEGDTGLANETQNNGDTQNLDDVGDHGQSNENETETPEVLEENDAGQAAGIRNEIMEKLTEPVAKPINS